MDRQVKPLHLALALIAVGAGGLIAYSRLGSSRPFPLASRDQLPAMSSANSNPLEENPPIAATQANDDASSPFEGQTAASIAEAPARVNFARVTELIHATADPVPTVLRLLDFQLPYTSVPHGTKSPAENLDLVRDFMLTEMAEQAAVEPARFVDSVAFPKLLDRLLDVSKSAKNLAVARGALEALIAFQPDRRRELVHEVSMARQENERFAFADLDA